MLYPPIPEGDKCKNRASRRRNSEQRNFSTGAPKEFNPLWG